MITASIGFILSVLLGMSAFASGVFGQDCFFYHHNTSDIYTTAFFGLPEDIAIGTTIATVDARIAFRVELLPDEGDLQGGAAQDLLEVLIRDNSTVQIIVQKSLRNLLPATRSLTFHLRCTGPSGAFTSLPFLVTILDVNDHAPSFTRRFHEVTVGEFHAVGLSIITPSMMKVVDGDLPNTPNTELNYQIVEGNELGYFAIKNAAEGHIILQKKLDYETGPRYLKLNITVSDRGDPVLSNWTSLVVIVADEDDQDPVFMQEIYSVAITEEWDSFKEILRLQARDGDSGLNETLKYEITDGLHNFLHHFVIDHVSGALSLLEPIDRERLPSSVMGYISLTVQASQANAPRRTARCTVRISVIDINDNGPKFAESSILKEIDLLPSIFDLDHIDIAVLSVLDRDAAQNAGFVSSIQFEGNNTDQMATMFRLQTTNGVNQTIKLIMQNISSLLLHFQSEFIVKVVVSDTQRSSARSVISHQEPDFMTDIAYVRVKFKAVPARLIRTLADLTNPSPTDRQLQAFMTQYPVTLLIVFGSTICVLLIVMLVMAAVYHRKLNGGRSLQRVRPFFVSGSSCSTRSSVLTSPISLTPYSSESHA